MSETPKLTQVIPARRRFDRVSGVDQESLIAQILTLIAEGGDLGAEGLPSLARQIVSRERDGTTGLGHEIAVPHLKDCSQVAAITGAFARTQTPIEWGSPDGSPVRLVFLLLSPPDFDTAHVQMMRQIVRVARDRPTVNYLLKAESLDNLEAIFAEAENG